MSTPYAELAGFDMACPDCGKLTHKKLAWLIVRDDMTCSHCGTLISLKGTEIGTAIKKLHDVCAQLDVRPAQKLD